MHSISPYSRAPISVFTMDGKRTRRRAPTTARRRGALRRSGAVIRIRVLALTRPCRPVRSAAARALCHRLCVACIAACCVCARKLAAHPEKSRRSLRMQAAFLERSHICITQ